ncbi:hypothetical protein TRIUR3_30636 [Triticum urartu]|uniref:Uncharacterized protein n=1 Tax=Triticum urartu TaxID=4572 RepID=M7Z5N0_TRIUA|nr:hypothetical protein TRIUR3_30636 [Triticum urartu]
MAMVTTSSGPPLPLLALPSSPANCANPCKMSSASPCSTTSEVPISWQNACFTKDFSSQNAPDHLFFSDPKTSLNREEMVWLPHRAGSQASWACTPGLMDVIQTKHTHNGSNKLVGDI